MALTATTTIEVESGGSDTANGGGFDPSNASMATDLAATSANTSAPVVTSATYNFAAGDVGAWLFIKSGTNWTPGWYKIASVAANAATLDGTIGHAVLTGISLSTVVGCATVASPTAGTWTVDYSQQTSPRTTLTAATAAGAGSTLTDSSIGKNWVGNTIQVTGGTNVTTGVFLVLSTSSTAATLDRAVTTGATSNAAGGMGGAFASPGEAGLIHVSGNPICIKSATFTVTSASSNVAGGCVTLNAATGNTCTKIIGYTTTRGDGAPTKPIIKADGVITTFTLLTMGASTRVDYIEFDGNSRTSSRGISTTSSSTAYKCVGRNFTNSFTNGTDARRGVFVLCYATTCSTQGAFKDGVYIGCVAYANTIDGFQASGSTGFFESCISAGNTGTGSGFSFATSANAVGCIAYGNAGSGFNSSSLFVNLINCMSVSNTGTGFAGSLDGNYLLNCAAFSAGTNFSGYGVQQRINCQTLSGDPFVAAASQNFALNNTVGAGASCRSAGLLGAYPTISTTGYQDIGVQHADPASGGFVGRHGQATF